LSGIEGLEQLDSATLKRLDLPKTAESPQGLSGIYLPKLISLVYVVNGIVGVPHLVDLKIATGVTTPGLQFTPPTGTKRIIFEMEFDYTATATVGTRTVIIEKRIKNSSRVVRYLNDGPTAGQARSYFIGPSNTTVGNVNVQITFPIELEPEWSITIDDGANIDAADSVTWQIEYVELPVT